MFGCVLERLLGAAVSEIEEVGTNLAGRVVKELLVEDLFVHLVKLLVGGFLLYRHFAEVFEVFFYLIFAISCN